MALRAVRADPAPAAAGSGVGVGVDQRTLSLCLSLIAGMVDVTSWLTLGGLFAAHITGNLVAVAAYAVGPGSPHLSQWLAIPVFAVTVVLADLLARGEGYTRGTVLRSLLLVQLLLLVVTLVLASTTRASDHPAGTLAVVVGMSAVAAMAVQNALLHLTRKSAPTTAVMTGNLVVCAIALTNIVLARYGERDRATDLEQWRATWPLLAGFLTGCFVGAAAVLLLSDGAWAVPVAVALVVYVAALRTSRDVTAPGRARAASSR